MALDFGVFTAVDILPHTGYHHFIPNGTGKPRNKIDGQAPVTEVAGLR